MKENTMKENAMKERMNLNMEDLEIVTGGEESILDRIYNRVKRIGERFINMIDAI